MQASFKMPAAAERRREFRRKPRFSANDLELKNAEYGSILKFGYYKSARRFCRETTPHIILRQRRLSGPGKACFYVCARVHLNRRRVRQGGLMRNNYEYLNRRINYLPLAAQLATWVDDFVENYAHENSIEPRKSYGWHSASLLPPEDEYSACDEQALLSARLFARAVAQSALLLCAGLERHGLSRADLLDAMFAAPESLCSLCGEPVMPRSSWFDSLIHAALESVQDTP